MVCIFLFDTEKENMMYVPKHGFEDEPKDRLKYFPMRELPDIDQTLIDTMIDINEDLSDKDLGYFVSMCNGCPWYRYQTRV